MPQQFQNFQPVVSEYLVYARPLEDEGIVRNKLGGYLWIAKLPPRGLLYIGTSTIDLFTVGIPLGSAVHNPDPMVLEEGAKVMQQKAADCFPEFSFDFVLHQKTVAVATHHGAEGYFSELLLLLYWLEEDGLADALFSPGAPHPRLHWPETKQWVQVREAVLSKLTQFVG